MTANQINYQVMLINRARAQEEARHNLAMEYETQRSNLAQEDLKNYANLTSRKQLYESQRANRANEGLQRGTLFEAMRANKVREYENLRHNTASENEARRHNKENENVAIWETEWRRQATVDDLNEQIRHNKEQEAINWANAMANAASATAAKINAQAAASTASSRWYDSMINAGYVNAKIGTEKAHAKLYKAQAKTESERPDLVHNQGEYYGKLGVSESFKPGLYRSQTVDNYLSAVESGTKSVKNVSDTVTTWINPALIGGGKNPIGFSK